MRMGILVLALLLAAGAVAAAATGPVVVVNSKDWHDKYLGAMYADQIGADLIYFTNLGDAQIKTQTIAQHRDVIAFESSHPVVKNYESVLKTNGFTNYTVTTYDDYHDLQNDLFTGHYDTLVVLDPTFGNEAIAISPLIGSKKLRPFFLDETNTGDLRAAERSADSIVVAGHFPVRLVDGIDASTSYTGLSPDNADAITRFVAAHSKSQWGVIMRIDRVDFVTLLENYPTVVYSGSLEDTVKTVKDINITKFEVISADAANLGKQIEDGSGENLALMLKYGRTITNLPGMTGKILDLDTSFVDYPSADLVIDSVDYYPDAGSLLVTYRNRGNVDTYFLTNIEYADNALTDPFLRVVPPQGTIKVAYPLDTAGNATDAFVNARYGMTVPLTNTLLSDQGTQLVRESVGTGSAKNLSITLKDVTYDDSKGALAVTIVSDTKGLARVDVPISDNLSFTSGAAEEIDGEHTFIIKTPYHRKDTFDRPLTISVSEGDSAPVYTASFTATPRITKNLLTGSVSLVASGALVLVLLALIIALVLYLRSRR